MPKFCMSCCASKQMRLRPPVRISPEATQWQSVFTGDGMLAAHECFQFGASQGPYEEDDNEPAENPPAAEDTNPPKSAAPVPPAAEAEEAQEAEEAEEAT